MKHTTLHTSLAIAVLLCFVGLAAWLGLQLRANSLRDKAYKVDFFTINQIKYGLLSGDNWTYQVNAIIASKIDSFRLDGTNRKVLVSEVNAILNRLFDEADKVLHQKRDNFKDKIRYKLINSFVEVDDFRKEIPRFSGAIVDELNNSKNKDEVKDLIKRKITDILSAAKQDTIGEQEQILNKYHFGTRALFNAHIAMLTADIKYEQQRYGYLLIGVMLATLLCWFHFIRYTYLRAMAFLFSVLISLVALFIGVSLPMIEIDARIGTLDLNLLASHVTFYDQVIFFQTKSILDVIHILIKNGKADTIFVGFLILLFSVLFPVTKLICTTVYLYRSQSSGRFVRFMAFNSGKWSMADVMVVAIFMAYVGFQNILDGQLADIDVHNDTINVVTTNRTNLQTGFIIFVAFVLFNLALAEILKRITKHRNQAAAEKPHAVVKEPLRIVKP